MTIENTTITWAGYEWNTVQPWGPTLEKKPLTWTDPSAVSVATDGLHLGVKYNPAWLPDQKGIYGGRVYSYGIGLVCIAKPFLYGHFKIEARLPAASPFAWPAFWLWGGAYGTPDFREIDIFEGYANGRGSYFRFGLPWWNVRANTYPPDRPKGRALWWNPATGFHTYELLWNPKTIAIWYDQKLVLVRDLVIDRPMSLVINNNIRQYAKIGTDLVVRSFTYRRL